MSDAANPYASPDPDATPEVFDGSSLLSVQIDPATALIAEGTLNEHDFRQAQKLHRQSYRWLGYLLLMLLVVFGGGGLNLFFGGEFNLEGYIFLAVLGYLVVALFVFPRLSARASWRKAHSLREPMRRLITPEVIQTITPTSNVTLRWSLFVRRRSSDDLMLLYLAEHPRMFVVVPRRLFRSDDHWQRFIAFAAQKLPAG